MKVVYGKARHVNKITLGQNLPPLIKMLVKTYAKSGYSPNYDIIILGQPPTGIYRGKPEKVYAITLSHEIIHRWLSKNIGEKASAQFDNIAPCLREYGVYWNDR